MKKGLEFETECPKTARHIAQKQQNLLLLLEVHVQHPRAWIDVEEDLGNKLSRPVL